MDGQQQQAAADAQSHVPAQSDSAQLDPTLMPQMPSLEAMAGVMPGPGFNAGVMADVLSGPGFMGAPTMAGMPMGDASLMAPIMFPNGQIPAQEQAKAVSAGTFFSLSPILDESSSDLNVFIFG
ncbi:hypothetical protein NQ176_g10717 [Zarea fungicola]|uniref:Uncharacterized protein n=1 Tax=Zarea fungicola TaxID=93591 RepID=A0ACC1ME77_9HYPO|nr:hypothetical protein NQ176_g10717 [Lecanicillium fungicola]